MKKIIVSLCSMLFMICVITVNNTVFADNEQYTEVTVTASTSRTYWEEDPEDSRYMIGKQYISFNTSPRSAGIIKIRFTTQNVNYNNNYSSPTLYSPNGVDCRYIGDIYGTSTDVWTYGNEFLIQWIDLQEFILIYEYKVLKTVYNSTQYAEITYNSLVTTGSYSNLNLRIIPSLEGVTPAELELINQNIELLVLNENLSDQQVEAYLQQINENYFPTLLTLLQSIEQNMENGDTPLPSIVYCRNTSTITRSSGYNANFYWRNTIIKQLNSDFEITSNGWVKCLKAGTVRVVAKPYAYLFYNSSLSTKISKNNTTVSYSGSRDYGIQFLTGYCDCVIDVEAGDIINCELQVSNKTEIYDWSTLTIEYVQGDSSDSVISKLEAIISNQVQSRTSIENNLQTIIEQLSEIVTNTEQSNEIDLNYQEITNIDNSVNQITNDYNTVFEQQTQNLPLTDLLNESSNEIINSSNLYNSVFADILDIPYMKGITSLIILCVVIVVLLG